MTLPMGCADCGHIRTQHVADDHRWQPPSMALIVARANAIKAAVNR